jgi:hypothetical protein
MKSPKLNISLGVLLVAAGLLVLPACSVNVKKDASGDDKKVDIETPVASLHVGKDANPEDTGLSVYPGARKKQGKDDGEEKSANLNISTSAFGLKVVAIEFESDASPDKIIAYYQDELKKYGNVLVCHTNKHGGETVEMHHSKDDSGHNRDLKCEGDGNGKIVELKVGTEDNQHIVSIKPEGKGTDFALVYVRTRDDNTI